ncbi:hypothetical protein [Tropicimonas sp.]|uniref:hypothetical protein n=1 Tax=Tropicimonas sp. TaxID=2067044 RepID=UPI003A8A0025
MKPIVTALAASLIAGACTQPPRPSADVVVDPATGATTGAVGVGADRINAGVTSSGTPYGSVDVIDTDGVDVAVGTGGASARIGNGPVRVRVGPGGIGLRL